MDNLKKDFNIGNLKEEEYLDISVAEEIEDKVFELDNFDEIIEEYENFNKEISDEIEALKMGQDENLQILEEVVLEQFGMYMVNDSIKDVDGGNVQTSHNYEKNILAPGVEKKDYDREDYEDKKKLNEYREKRKNEGTYYSDYSGKNVDDNGHIDHGVSLKKGHEKYGFVGEEKVKNTLNHEDNYSVLSSSENTSKGEKSIKEWENTERENGQTNKEYFERDDIKAKELEKKEKTTENKLKKEAAKYYVKNTAKEGLKSGFEIFIKNFFTESLITCNKEFLLYVKENTNGEQGIIEFSENIKNGGKKGIEKIFKEMKEILKKSVSSMQTGFFSTVVTTIINIFFTTVIGIIKSIRAIINMLKRMKGEIQKIKNGNKQERKKVILNLILGGILTLPIFQGMGITQAVENVLLKVGIPNLLSDILALGITTIMGVSLILLFNFIIEKIKHSNIRKLEILNANFEIQIAQAKAIKDQIELKNFFKETEEKLKKLDKEREILMSKFDEELENSKKIGEELSSMTLDLPEIDVPKNTNEDIKDFLEELKKLSLRCEF